MINPRPTWIGNVKPGATVIDGEGGALVIIATEALEQLDLAQDDVVVAVGTSGNLWTLLHAEPVCAQADDIIDPSASWPGDEDEDEEVDCGDEPESGGSPEPRPSSPYSFGGRW